MVVSHAKHQDSEILHNTVWVLLADMGQAKLLRCGLTRHDRCHVECRDTLDNNWPVHDHPKSSPQWKNASVSYGVEDDEHEDHKRFVGETVDWLTQKMKTYGIENVVVLAPPRFTGVLRKTKFSRHHPVSIIQHQADLINLPTQKLAEHATIQALVAAETETD